MRQLVQELVDTYTKNFPNEAELLCLLIEQLKQPGDIISRKNFVGHVTASGFIVNRTTRKVLLLEHKVLLKLLQPGGHVEPGDHSPLNAAFREIEEETGITKEHLIIHSIVSGSDDVPFDIDVHYIPENKKKEESGHYHHDFRYLFTTQTDKVEIDLDESNGYRWVEWESFAQMSQFVKVADKIDSIL